MSPLYGDFFFLWKLVVCLSRFLSSSLAGRMLCVPRCLQGGAWDLAIASAEYLLDKISHLEITETEAIINIIHTS